MNPEQESSSAVDRAAILVPQAGRLVATGEPWEPYRLLDVDGVEVEAVSSYFKELQAAGRSAATARSYGMDLLRWFRFLWAPGVPSRIPRSVPDAEFNEIFARLPSHRDRALVAFYVSTGARASELLSVTQGGVDPGRQLITVVRKGTGASQQLPASTDAFVWLRLYQLERDGAIPTGRREPLWWTLRSPARPLTYHAVHRMFERVNVRAGTAATLHSLRHTAAYRMAEDPALPLTDVQLVLGHAHLTTTQLYLTPRKEDVIRRVLAHHAEQTRRAAERVVPVPAPGYRPETLRVLFGGSPS